jgi:sterol desaturase/sphingolipid hydroxylase (fatty acid hydroxylase superfamily)
MDSAFFSHLIALLQLRKIAAASLYASVVFAVMFVIIYLLEWRQGADQSRYKSRTFACDVAYAFFYRGEIYTVFVLSLVLGLFEPHVQFLKLDLIKHVPAPLAYLTWWLTFDFFGYWMHRAQHHSRFLWAFHSVHHAPKELNFLQSFRLHVVEQLIANLVMYVPAVMIGMPARIILPVYMVQVFFESVQHSELHWRYGPFYRLVVSPGFHAFHHSAERRHYDRNFGKILSVWDFLFGTAVEREPRPTRFGIDGYEIPESLVQQFLSSFRYLRKGPTAALVPETATMAATSMPPPAATATPADASAAPHTAG